MEQLAAREKDGISFLIPILIGVAAFVLVIGYRVLLPTNIGWLSEGDPIQHFLGWEFFRNSNWTFPIGLNPDYGLEISNAIVYSDSNPLLAFIFKLFSPLLPKPFQYFGFWLLACFILQAWYAWKISVLASSSRFIKAVVAALFVFSPPMILRMDGHLSLAGHFLILAALYLSLKPRYERRTFYWILLLVIAALVHAYLLAMTSAIWVADLFAAREGKRIPCRTMMCELGAITSILVLVVWQAGYFSVGDGVQSGGFGTYRMNLLSLVDANGWSYFLPSLAKAEGDYEGFNYLGGGVLFLAICCVPVISLRRRELQDMAGNFRFLFAVLVALTMFSLSNNIGIGTFSIRYPLPHDLEKISNVFRASGRMFWPVFYVINFLLIFSVIKSYGVRASRFLLSMALLIQVVDTSAAWIGLHRKRMIEPKHEWPTPLVDAFWQNASHHYSKVRWLLPENHSPHWESIAGYADRNRLGTDAVYLARIGNAALQNAQHAEMLMLESGKYSADSLYIIDDKLLAKAASSVIRETDLLARIDGLNVLAPGWKQCQTCTAINSEIQFDDISPSPEIEKKVPFNQSGGGLPWLVKGWASPESWGTWSAGEKAEIKIPVSRSFRKIRIQANALISSRHPVQRVRISIQKNINRNFVLKQAEGNVIEIELPSHMRADSLKDGIFWLEFFFEDAARPKDIGINSDERTLALGLKSIEFF